MYVYEVMETDVQTIHREATFKEIIDLLVTHKISGTPVIDDDRHLVGILSEKDLLQFLFPTEEEFYTDVEYWKNPHHLMSEAKRIVKMRANDFLTREVITVRPRTKILTACSLLLVHSIRRLPVIDDDKLVGIVTTNNLYRNFLQTLV